MATDKTFIRFCADLRTFDPSDQQERKACQGSVFTLLTFSFDLRISASHERWKTDPLRTVCWHWGAWCNSQKCSFVSSVLFVVSSNVVKNSNELFQITSRNYFLSISFAWTEWTWTWHQCFVILKVTFQKLLFICCDFKAEIFWHYDILIILPAAELVDQPTHYGPDQHVDPAQEAAHPGHGGTVTGKMIIKIKI